MGYTIIKFTKIYEFMESSTFLIISIGAFLVAITGFAIYISFGPPSRQLADPFDDHED